MYKRFVSFIAAGAPQIKSIFQGALTSNSPLFAGLNITTGGYRYQSIQLTVSTSGTYRFQSNGTLGLSVYLYTPAFTATSQFTNLINSDDLSAAGLQFDFSNDLQANVVYVLVITTYIASNTGSYTLTVTGPATIVFTDISPTTTTTTSKNY